MRAKIKRNGVRVPGRRYGVLGASGRIDQREEAKQQDIPHRPESCTDSSVTAISENQTHTLLPIFSNFVERLLGTAR